MIVISYDENLDCMMVEDASKGLRLPCRDCRITIGTGRCLYAICRVWLLNCRL